MIETEKKFVIARHTRPAALAGGEDSDEIETHAVKTDMYREDIKNYVKRRSILEDNMESVCEVVWGQCTQQTRAKVESSDKYAKVHNDSDLLGLFNLIKISSFDFHSQKNSYHGLIELEKAFKNFRQQKSMSCEDYHEQFVASLKHMWVVEEVLENKKDW